MWPPTTAAIWIVQTRPGGRNDGVRLEERPAESAEVRALLERIGDGDDDPLAVDEQVREVVGDQVADGDRQQPRPGRAGRRRAAPRPGRPAAITPRNPSSWSVSIGTAGAPNTANHGVVWDSPSYRIDPSPIADEHDVGGRPAGLEQTRRERPPPDPARVVDVRERREPVQQPEPHREGLAVPAPRVAPELGHHRQRERGVADEDDEQRARIRRRPRRARARRRTRARSTAGQRPSQPGYSAGSQPWTPSRRATPAPMSKSVANGSSQCQIGPTSAETIAIPTQP